MFNPLCDPLPSLYLCAAVLVPVVAGVRPFCPISPYNNTVQSVRCMLLFIIFHHGLQFTVLLWLCCCAAVLSAGCSQHQNAWCMACTLVHPSLRLRWRSACTLRQGSNLVGFPRLPGTSRHAEILRFICWWKSGRKHMDVELSCLQLARICCNALPKQDALWPNDLHRRWFQFKQSGLYNTWQSEAPHLGSSRPHRALFEPEKQARFRTC